MPSQNIINRQWVFGVRAGLDFSTPVPTPTSGFLINTGEGCASISNANGQLLLYTDGNTLWDGTNTPRASGVASGLAGNPSSTQSAIIVPDPANSQRYYIFTTDGVVGTNRHFNGMRIDVSTWNSVPLSSLMTMPTVTNLSPTEKVTAIQHANCIDYWVITILQNIPDTPNNPAANGAGIFRVFLVNSTGVQHVSDTPMNVNVTDVGYLKADPTGSRLAVANYQNRNVLLYNFDNALGVLDISSLVTINVPALPAIPNHPRAPYGVEFSPNSNVLYYSLLGVGGSGTAPTNNGYIFQVDLTVSAPVSTQIVQYSNIGIGYAIGALQLGIDGRIYVAKHGESGLGAILNPNVVGSGCNPSMTPHFITLVANTTCNLGLPNLLPNQCDCPCETGCDEDVNKANQILNDRAERKEFTIIANGQTLPTTCNLAFSNANFAPVFTLEWGDGPSDHFESDDLEVIYIRIHNPFRNLIYRDITIFNVRITPNQTLPDGDDAIRIIPAEIACFDEIQSCSYVSRDFALIIDHALVGTYHISFDYCIGEIAIVSTEDGSAVFDINVVAS
jgi:hypothetical protein